MVAVLIVVLVKRPQQAQVSAPTAWPASTRPLLVLANAATAAQESILRPRVLRQLTSVLIVRQIRIVRPLDLPSVLHAHQGVFLLPEPLRAHHAMSANTGEQPGALPVHRF